MIKLTFECVEFLHFFGVKAHMLVDTYTIVSTVAWPKANSHQLLDESQRLRRRRRRRRRMYHKMMETFPLL